MEYVLINLTIGFNNYINYFVVGMVTTVAGGTSSRGSYMDGQGTAARFNYPTGIAVDINNALYVADTNNNAIRVISPTGKIPLSVNCSVYNITSLLCPMMMSYYYTILSNILSTVGYVATLAGAGPTLNTGPLLGNIIYTAFTYYFALFYEGNAMGLYRNHSFILFLIIN